MALAAKRIGVVGGKGTKRLEKGDSLFDDALDGVHAFDEDVHTGAVGEADEI